MDALLLTAFVLACPVLAVLAGSLLLYGIPVRSSVRLLVQEDILQESVTVTWGFTGIRLRHERQGAEFAIMAGRHALSTYTSEPERGIPPPSARDTKPKEETGTPAPAGTGGALRLAAPLIRPSVTLLSVIWRESRFDGMTGRITMGTGDPALTGEIFGHYWASRFLLEAMRVSIELEPVFDREVFSCDLEASISIRHPLLVLIAAIRLALHPAAREILMVSRQKSFGTVAA
jgi:hypothetical protein